MMRPMTGRLIDTIALLALLAFIWLAATRLGFIISPNSCWTSC